MKEGVLLITTFWIPSILALTIGVAIFKLNIFNEFNIVIRKWFLIEFYKKHHWTYQVWSRICMYLYIFFSLFFLIQSLVEFNLDKFVESIKFIVIMAIFYKLGSWANNLTFGMK